MLKVMEHLNYTIKNTVSSKYLAEIVLLRNTLLLPPPSQLVIRVHMSDESSKTMMVDERQSVRQVLDSLLDKSHCGYSPDWSLVETITELQMGKEERGKQNPLGGRNLSAHLWVSKRKKRMSCIFFSPRTYL